MNNEFLQNSTTFSSTFSTKTNLNWNLLKSLSKIWIFSQVSIKLTSKVKEDFQKKCKSIEITIRNFYCTTLQWKTTRRWAWLPLFSRHIIFNQLHQPPKSDKKAFLCQKKKMAEKKQLKSRVNILMRTFYEILWVVWYEPSFISADWSSSLYLTHIHNPLEISCAHCLCLW